MTTTQRETHSLVNPYLAALVTIGMGGVLVGLVLVFLVEPAYGELFSAWQFLGLAMFSVGLVALLGWLVAAAIVWRHDS